MISGQGFPGNQSDGDLVAHSTRAVAMLEIAIVVSIAALFFTSYQIWTQ